MYTPNMTQTTLTSRKYLTPSRKNYLRDHNGLGSTKKQMKESNKTGFLPPMKKTYYCNLKSEQQPDCQDTLLDKQALTAFWVSIWGNAVKHNLKASWIRREQTRVSNVTAMEHSPITTEQVSQLTAKTLKWKALGSDGIHNFWIKRFTATHSYLAH